MTEKNIDGFIADVQRHARWCPNTWEGKLRFIRTISHEYAYIRVRDLKNPLRFWFQTSGAPPKRFGRVGFEPRLVDDSDPARHYTAFVFVGFWLPICPALIFLWIWEILGFFRYGGIWSQEDIRLGCIGIRHGRLVRQIGPSVLPGLIDRDLRVRNESGGSPAFLSP